MRPILLCAMIVVLLAACQPAIPPSATPPPATPTPAAPAPSAGATPAAPGIVTQGKMLEPTGFIRQIHDPVIAHEGDTYYVFSTGARIPFICSKDMVAWEFCGRVFEKYPAWTSEVNPDLADAWAPDISYFNGLWHLYYAVSSFGSQNSAIGLATNKTLDPKSPDYKWEDRGIVLRSQPGDRWNAIDPNLVLDENGEPWLAWGSFWQGLWLRQVDAATGLLDETQKDAVHLADRSAGPKHNPAIEAAFIVRRGDYWYLFASYDQCCQGAASTYNVRVGRSGSLTGPYVDRDGVPLTKGGGTLILAAYENWKGPGHNGMLVEDGVYWMVYHTYDAQVNGVPKLRIESLSWDSDDWPSLPSQTPKGGS